MSTVLRMPRIRLKQFSEHRLRTPARGAVVDEYVDRFLTEPLTPRLHRWMDDRDNIVLSPTTAHRSVTLGEGASLITVMYVLLTVAKSDIVQLMYGT